MGSIEKIEEGAPGKLKVTAKYKDGTTYADEFNTVIFAIGRDACTQNIGLDKVGVALNPKNGKVLHDEAERTNVDSIYAIGDVLDDKPELTPVAIQAGALVGRRRRQVDRLCQCLHHRVHSAGVWVLWALRGRCHTAIRRGRY